MPKPRVMQLVLSLAPGGTERLVIEIVRRLNDRIESVVCCLDERGGWADEVERLGVPVFTLSRQPGFHPGLALELSRLLKEHRIDVIHCHHYSPYVYGLLAKMVTPGVKLVFTEHGRLSDGAPSTKRRLVNPLLALGGGQLYAVSAALKQHMVSEGFPDRRVGVLYNGIDPGERRTRAQCLAMRAELGIAPDAFVVGSIGRLVEVKQFDLLLQAHALMRSRVNDLHTVIVGEGPERTRLESLASTLGIASEVHFAGHRNDARAVLAAFNVFANSSIYEGVSLTILEAMAAALPVVATRVGGNPEVVLPNETGCIVPGNAQALADAIVSLSHHPERRRDMGEAGRWRVIRHFSMTRMVDDYARAYLGDRHFAAQSETAAAPPRAPIAAERISVSDATRSMV